MRVRLIYSYNKTESRPSFGRPKNIDLIYAVTKVPHLLPPRVHESAEKIAHLSYLKTMPTLYDLHKEIYKPLLQCKTLDEARNIFPEFREILSADAVLQRKTNNVKNLTVPLDKLSLHILQEYYAKLTPKEKIAENLGLTNRSALQWILDKINFAPFPKNYFAVLKGSDKELKNEMAEKTRAHNLLNPTAMYERNKIAAQKCKTQKYRQEQSERMLEYDRYHPERREKISKHYSEVWARLPHIRKAQRAELAFHPYYRELFAREQNGEVLTDFERKKKKLFYKHFWDKYPQYLEEYQAMCNKVTEEKKNGLKL